MKDFRDEQLRRQGWSHRVRCYYADDVKPPKTPGALAIETVQRGESSAQMEAEVGRGRPDIGTVTTEVL